MEYKSLTKYNKHYCRLCGKECTGKTCIEFYDKVKYGSLSRKKVYERYNRGN